MDEREKLIEILSTKIHPREGIDPAAVVADFLLDNDVVPVVRCRDCRWAKSYNRNDGEIGYCCHFCGHEFKYGTDWKQIFMPIKEADDFCSYGERKEECGDDQT